MAKAASLLVRNLTLSYGDRVVLSDVNLAVNPGDFVGLIGPNACGKSTLLKAVSRVLQPDAGSVVLDGRDVWRQMTLAETARSVAVVPQDFPVGFPFTVEETVALGRTPYVSRLRGEKPRDLAQAREAMRVTGTLALGPRLLSELAGGERQRVILAKALAQEPRLLLLDEPTSHLDINHQVEILDLLLRLNRTGDLTVVIVLHDLNLASIYCDCLYLLGRGGVVAAGGPEEVLTAGNLQSVYGSRVLVGRHPVYGCPQVTLLSQLRAAGAEAPAEGVSAGPDRAGRDTLRVHVVAGGGTSGELLESLVAAGHQVTVGPLNAGDSDWHVARTLGLEVTTVPPFSPVDRAALDRAKAAMAPAAAVVVAPVPFGHGNAAVLEAVLERTLAGHPVAVVTSGASLGAALSERDFTGGRVAALATELERAGAVSLPGPRDVLTWVAGLGRGRRQERGGDVAQ